VIHNYRCPYSHRTVDGGTGHNIAQEAPKAFADSVMEVRTTSSSHPLEVISLKCRSSTDDSSTGGHCTTGWGLQARDQFGHDLRSGLWPFGERNALSGPQR
jgi:hypothetical protein